MNIQIRRLTPADAELQKELIYIALWDHPDEPRRPVNVLEHPVVRAYYEDWGREGDIGLLAVSNDRPAGFIQLRTKECVTEEYASFPELSIAVFPEFHRQGVAGILWNALCEEARDQFPGVRLGVHPRNDAAITLYKKLGFTVYAHPPGAYPQMVLHFE
ncbi:MAG: GNAT family N-acetyltransferase [Oceanospirillaceae bacterium]|nr:GNAT family N-acetyltransferase [Oceanospirillaceae bacterium]